MSELANRSLPGSDSRRGHPGRAARRFLLILPLLAASAWLWLAARGATPSVRPTAQTAPMPGRGDVADDVCLWVHPGDGARSVLFGANKSDDRSGGIFAFRLDGSMWGNVQGWHSDVNWFDMGRKINNVDSCRGFPAAEAKWDLVAAANRTDRALDLFRVHTDARGDFARLELVGRIPVGAGFGEGASAPYGLALALWTTSDPTSPIPDADFSPGPSPTQASIPVRCLAFASDTGGRLAQYELQFIPGGTGANQITARRYDDHGRPWEISERGEEVEGMVADVARGVLYVAHENEGVFRYRLKNGVFDPQSKTVIDRVGSRLKADVEGLALYARADGTGYLLASSQGSSQFAVYRREFLHDEPNPPVANFKVGRGKRNGDRIGAVRATDGIEAVAADLGGVFREGLFVAHDGDGDSPSNYKLVPWSAIRAIGVR